MLYATQEVLIWLSVLLSIPLGYCLYLRWEKTDHISPGYFWSGLLSTFFFSLCLIICAAVPQLAYIFCWLGILAVLISVGYEQWYTNRYPGEYVRVERVPPYVPKNRFTQWMSENTPPVYAKWLQPFSKSKVQWGILLFLVGFGFIRVMNAIAYGTQQVALERKKAREELVQTQKQIPSQIQQAVVPVLQVSQQALNQLQSNVGKLNKIEKNTQEEPPKPAPKVKKKPRGKVPVYTSKLETPRTALDSLAAKPVQPIATLTH